ncbi:hypothetical protein [Parabacteroides sp. FAFU027]|uniref:hypothetical protein n=1 Tax=Parabacteroides sp. FAFU027 TaxID=2922715 RepID=UPI001FAF7B20|nr:hypothetical protein [Parabacteroides sp. FAFU027]
MKPRLKYKRIEDIDMTGRTVNGVLHQIVHELKVMKTTEIHVENNKVLFKNKSFEWRYSWDLMGIVTDGFIEVVETPSGAQLYIECYHPFWSHFIFILVGLVVAFTTGAYVISFLFSLGSLASIAIANSMVSNGCDDMISRIIPTQND